MKRNLTVGEVEDRFVEAAMTLRRLPNPPGSGPNGYGSWWPDYVQEAKHAYGYNEARMRVVPAAAEIDRMEAALEWLALVDPEDARIIWMRAEGYRWRHVCIHAGCVRQTAWRRWVAALQTVTNRLNGRRNRPRGKKISKKSPETQKSPSV